MTLYILDIFNMHLKKERRTLVYWLQQKGTELHVAQHVVKYNKAIDHSVNTCKNGTENEIYCFFIKTMDE